MGISSERPEDADRVRGSGRARVPSGVVRSAVSSVASSFDLNRWHGLGCHALRHVGILSDAAASKLVVALLSFLPYALLGQTWILAGRSVEEATGMDLALPPAGSVTAIPGRLAAFHALFLVVLWLPRRWQLPTAAAGALAITLGARLVDIPAILALAVAALAFRALFSAPLPRWLMLASIVGGVPLLRTLSHAFGWEALARPSISTGLIVVLWYACYQVTTNKAMSLGQYFAYVETRLLMEGPVFTLQDFTRTDEHKVTQARLAGVSALVIATMSRSLSHHLGVFVEDQGWRESETLALLGFSYLKYLSLAFALVGSYNLYLGLFRLFGLPIRDNFHWWILARTPNEHWRRWNLLLREWLVTFTFYPMMRARVPLFLSVMGTLLISGAMHVWAHIGTDPFDVEKTLITMTYWTLNGLAIYAVVKIPRRFPNWHARLGFATSRAWWVTGWTLTSVFYAVAFTVAQEANRLRDAGDYFERLLGLA